MLIRKDLVTKISGLILCSAVRLRILHCVQNDGKINTDTTNIDSAKRDVQANYLKSVVTSSPLKRSGMKRTLKISPKGRNDEAQ